MSSPRHLLGPRSVTVCRRPVADAHDQQFRTNCTARTYAHLGHFVTLEAYGLGFVMCRQSRRTRAQRTANLQSSRAVGATGRGARYQSRVPLASGFEKPAQRSPANLTVAFGPLAIASVYRGRSPLNLSRTERRRTVALRAAPQRWSVAARMLSARLFISR